MNDPQNTDTNDEKTNQEKIYESVKFVVDMMNSGNVDPKEVYPRNRYSGD